jgi:Ala-tRNA(Pro) deacylase
VLNPSLNRLLQDSGVTYETIRHRPAGTAQAVAAAAHVSGHDLAKCVVLRMDDGYALAVVPATKHVDLERFLDVCRAQSVMVARELEFQGLFPGCELGAEPPFGELFGVPVWVDEKLTRKDWIAFNGGTHDEVVRMRYDDYARLAQPRIGDFARP